LQVAEHNLSRYDTFRIYPENVGFGASPGHVDKFCSIAERGRNKNTVGGGCAEIAGKTPIGAPGEKGAGGLAGLCPGESVRSRVPNKSVSYGGGVRVRDFEPGCRPIGLEPDDQ